MTRFIAKDSFGNINTSLRNYLFNIIVFLLKKLPNCLYLKNFFSKKKSFF